MGSPCSFLTSKVDDALKSREGVEGSTSPLGTVQPSDGIAPSLHSESKKLAHRKEALQ